MRAVDLQVDAFGDVAVATFVLDYHFDARGATLAKRANTTMVFIRQEGSWKITHEHLSVPKPSP